MTAPRCERCGRDLQVGDRVLEVRRVSRVSGTSIGHDRGDAVAHVQCPTEEGTDPW